MEEFTRLIENLIIRVKILEEEKLALITIIDSLDARISRHEDRLRYLEGQEYV